MLGAMFLLTVVPVEARKKRDRRTQHLPPAKHRVVPYKKFERSPSFSVPKGQLLSFEQLRREDREGVTNRDIYTECMNSKDPLSEAFRFYNKERTSVSVRGSNERLAYELCVIDALKITRFLTVEEIVQARGKTLFPITNNLIGKHEDLPLERYVASLWAKEYLDALADDMRDEIKDTINVDMSPPVFTVSSTVRDILRQREQYNSPARCRFDGDLCSSHTTGSTFDITLKNYPDWRRKILFRLLDDDRKKGIIFWIYERSHEHCHVFVFPPEFRERFTVNVAKEAKH